MSEDKRNFSKIHNVVTNAILYQIIMTAVTAPAINRNVDKVQLSTIVADSINQNLSTVE